MVLAVTHDVVVGSITLQVVTETKPTKPTWHFINTTRMNEFMWYGFIQIVGPIEGVGSEKNGSVAGLFIPNSLGWRAFVKSSYPN